MFSWRDLDLYLQSKLWRSSFKSSWLDGIHSLRKSNRPRIWSLTIRGMAFCKRIDFSDKNATLYCRESKCIFNISSDVKASPTSSDFVNTKKYRKQKNNEAIKLLRKRMQHEYPKIWKEILIYLWLFNRWLSLLLSRIVPDKTSTKKPMDFNQKFPLSPDEGFARRFWYDELIL